MDEIAQNEKDFQQIVQVTSFLYDKSQTLQEKISDL